jgi:hypothetical protein
MFGACGASTTHTAVAFSGDAAARRATGRLLGGGPQPCGGFGRELDGGGGAATLPISPRPATIGPLPSRQENQQ